MKTDNEVDEVLEASDVDGGGGRRLRLPRRRGGGGRGGRRRRRRGGGCDVVDASEIDAYWLQRQIASALDIPTRRRANPARPRRRCSQLSEQDATLVANQLGPDAGLRQVRPHPPSAQVAFRGLLHAARAGAGRRRGKSGRRWSRCRAGPEAAKIAGRDAPVAETARSGARARGRRRWTAEDPRSGAAAHAAVAATSGGYAAAVPAASRARASGRRSSISTASPSRGVAI